MSVVFFINLHQDISCSKVTMDCVAEEKYHRGRVLEWSLEYTHVQKRYVSMLWYMCIQGPNLQKCNSTHVSGTLTLVITQFVK